MKTEKAALLDAVRSFPFDPRGVFLRRPGAETNPKSA